MEFTEIRQVHISEIIPHKLLFKRAIDPNAREAFVKDIKKNGVLEAVILAPEKTKSGKYILLNGYRRWSTAKALKISSIPAKRLIENSESNRRRVMYGGNQLGEKFKADEIIQIIIMEYGKSRIEVDTRGNKNRNKETLSVMIASEFGISQRQAQRYLKDARNYLNTDLKKGKYSSSLPELKPGEMRFLNNRINKLLKLEEEIASKKNQCQEIKTEILQSNLISSQKLPEYIEKYFTSK